MEWLALLADQGVADFQFGEGVEIAVGRPEFADAVVQAEGGDVTADSSRGGISPGSPDGCIAFLSGLVTLTPNQTFAIKAWS